LPDLSASIKKSPMSPDDVASAAERPPAPASASR
jgi:hypothetical protein